jgi:hypothetical protein
LTAQSFELTWQEPQCAGQPCAKQHDEEGRKYAVHAALVEPQDIDAPLAGFADEDARDQKAGDDEKTSTPT